MPDRPVVAPNPLSPDWLTLVAGEYGGTLRALVLAHKERGALGLARPLGTVLARVLVDVVPDEPMALVPVPSSRRSTRLRGHDPMLRVARVAAARLRAAGRDAVVVPLLRQRGGVRDQASLSGEERFANLEGAHRVRAGSLRCLEGRGDGVVVCDDVLTTGATAHESRRALRAAGVEPAGFAALAASRRRESVEKALQKT